MWVMIAAIDHGANDGATGWCVMVAKWLWHGNVESRIDGTCDGGLCLPCRLLSIIDCIGIMSCLRVEADGAMWARVVGIGPWCSRFQCIFGGLLSKTAESPFF